MKTCVKCGKNIPDDGRFCPYCGTDQKAAARVKKNKRTRANGEGAIHKNKNGKWTAAITISRTPRKRITKNTFRTKAEAVAWVEHMHENRIFTRARTLRQLYDEWDPWYAPRVTERTMDGYRGSFKHLVSLYDVQVDRITAAMLQDCIDKCPSGHRTKQMIKCTASLLMKYAMDNNIIVRNPAANLYIGNGATTHYEPITDEELDRIEASGQDYSEYVVAMCYLGFRPTEFFNLKKTDLKECDGIRYLVGGIKTEAGKNRQVTIPPRIVDIINDRMNVVGTDYLFPRVCRNKKGDFVGYSIMSRGYWSEHVFKPMMKELGIEGKVPYSSRHTYSNKIGDVDGADKDKAALMGHVDYTTTKKHYQSSDLKHKEDITNKMA